MNIYKIAAILIDNGFNTKVDAVTKNGEELTALVVGDAPISACFYTRDFFGTEEEVANNIMDTMRETKMPEIDMELLTNWEKAKDVIMVGVRKHINDNLVTVQILDLQAYFYIEIIGCGIVKVNRKLFEAYGVTKEEMLRVAISNTAKEMEIVSMGSILVGVDIDVDDNDANILYVITNKSKSNGASAILCKDVLNAACEKLNTSMIWVIPSSIHEVIVKRVDNYDERDALSNLICFINCDMVEPSERLADHPYLYTKGGEIEIK